MLRPLTAIALLLALAGAAARAAEPVPASMAVPQGAKQRIDETALRYYASLGRRDRVEAEMHRLAKLDPAWHAPADLYNTHKGRDDEGPLWALYQQNRLADIERAVALRQVAEPGWKPSDDLQAKIRAKVLRAKVMALAKAEQWHAIVESFRASGIGWAKNDAEALWVVAEAYAHENDCSEAYIVYQQIMTGHDDPAERRATIEFAIRLIPMAMVEKLIALGHSDASGRGEFAPIEIDITRARISAFLHDEQANAVGDDELKRFEDYVHDVANPDEPGLVAWYGYKRADYKLALEWFKLSLSHGGDAMIAHGLAHTLRVLGMTREAEEVAYAWRGPLVNNSILFIDLLERDFTKRQPPFIEPERVTRYAQVTVQTESGEGAQALAWYAYNTCQYPLALRWFERAMAWLPKEATAYGYALSLQRMHKAKEFRDLVNRYDGLFPKVVQLAFDDGRRQPPPPCESNPHLPSAPPREAMGVAGDTGGSFDWTGRTMADTLHVTTSASPAARRSAMEAMQRPGFVRARVPSPDDALDATMPSGSLPLVKRTEYPVAVTPENMLRFSALHTLATEDAGARTHGREPAAGPLVARRVPGVGPMPYERWGFTLLPGWDGTAEASSPTAMEKDPPVGTLWALELSLREGGSKKRQPAAVLGAASSAAPAVKDGIDVLRPGRPS